MKALSIQQPWAWLIVNGHKDVENRTWMPNKGFAIPQRIYIHVGLKPRPTSEVPDWERFDGVYWTSRVALGAIIGEVDLVDINFASDSEWAEPGMCHWILENPVAYEKAIPCRGKLRLFEVEI